MCLILCAWDADPHFQLVVAANRDEFYDRASLPMRWWEDRPILGGRDLKAGGGWLTLSVSGRFGTVTNIRDFARMDQTKRSRGDIPVDFCVGTDAPGDYLHRLPGDDFNGYNALVGDAGSLWWGNNWNGEPTPIEPGVHGISNAALNTPWPKVVQGRDRLAAALAAGAETEDLFALLADRTIAPDEDLPTDTNAPIEIERLASAAFIVSEAYGTNASTVLRIRRDRSWDAEERRFLRGEETGRVAFSGTFGRD